MRVRYSIISLDLKQNKIENWIKSLNSRFTFFVIRTYRYYRIETTNKYITNNNIIYTMPIYIYL